MARCDKIARKARRSPKSLKFAELCYLAECYGFAFERRSGSHRIYKHPTYPRLMNFQPRKDGSAKGYQVQLLLEAIDALAG